MTLVKFQIIRSLDISGCELIVWPSHYIFQKIAYPLDGVVQIIGDLFHCHVEGQTLASTDDLETFRRINTISTY